MLPYSILRIAHRGASAHYPENTLLAFRQALEQGIDLLELDFHLTREGALVVIHDATLDRTTNGAGLVREHRLAEIRQLDAGQGQQVPTLAEVIALVQPSPVWLCAEVKGQTETESLAIAEALVTALGEANFLSRSLVTSFYPAALQRAKALEPGLALVFDPSPQDGSLTPRQICEQTLAAGANCVSYDFRFLTEAIVAECRRAGLALWPWDPDEPEDLRRVAQMGVPGIMTNRPDQLNAVLAGLTRGVVTSFQGS